MKTLNFKEKEHNRYWWYKLSDTDYIPPVIANLKDEEWQILNQWFIETELKYPSPGEISIPGISFLAGLIGGNGVRSIVQCGHYVGFSTLILGFLLRSMGKESALYSIDLDEDSTKFTQKWLDKASLNKQVKLKLSNSSDAKLPKLASEYFGNNPPQIVFIDSSHQYSHTLEELDLWYDAIPVGGFLILHDVTSFAATFDSSGKGGVLLAVEEWSKKKGVKSFLINSFVDGTQELDTLVYKDGCGIGVIQK